MDRIFTLYDLERRVYGRRSRNSTTAKQRGLRRVLKILYDGNGVGRGRRYEWSERREFDKVVAHIRTLRRTLCD